MWRTDCENLRLVSRTFELHDVSSPEHFAFAEAFAAKNRLSLKHGGDNVLFVPQGTEE